MSATTAHLIKMAQEIAQNLATGKSPEEAAIATAAHLKRFWSPAMREDLVSALREDAVDDDVMKLLPELIS